MADAPRIFVFCLLLITSETLKLPEYIKACSRNDPNFNECALKNGRQAIPRIIKGDREYGVPILDPLFVEKLSLSHAGFYGTGKNMTIVGVKEAEIDDFNVDFDKQIIKVAYQTPRLKLNGKYEITGKILMLPISGDGDFEVIFS